MNHAAASPSPANVWLEVPASITRAEGRTRRTSAYAKEGTAAHRIAEMVINGDLFPPKKITVEGSEFIVSMEMLKALNPYIDFIEKLQAQGFQTEIEKKVEIPLTGGMVWGTADCIGFGGDILHVVDLKYGKGVPVDPGPQLQIYAIGALALWPKAPIYEVSMTIIQPRLNPTPQTWTVPTDWLIDWWADTLTPAVGRLMNGDQTEKAGTWCRWCVRKHECLAFHAKRAGFASSIFDDGIDTVNT